MAGLARGRLIGVDVETVTAVFDQQALARRACSPEELDALREQPSSERRVALADMWTAKESILKAAGQGLSGDPRLVHEYGARLIRVAGASGGMSAAVALLRAPGKMTSEKENAPLLERAMR